MKSDISSGKHRVFEIELLQYDIIKFFWDLISIVKGFLKG